VEAGLIDFEAERKVFLYVKRSASTRSAYRNALRIFEEWLARKGLAPIDLTPGLALDFIQDLRSEARADQSGMGHPRSANIVRTIVTACSSFYTHLERRYAEIRNPFRGIQARLDLRKRGGAR